MKKNRQKFLEVIAHCGVFFSIAGIIILLLQLSVPAVSDVWYQYDGKPQERATLPLSIESAGDSLDIRFTMELRTLYAHLFRFAPDGCISSINVNGKDVKLESEELCSHPIGHLVNLDDWLHPGKNLIIVKMRDDGGRAGLDVRVAATDPLRLAANIVLLITACWFATRVTMELIDRRDFPWVWVLLILGLLVRLSLAGHEGYGFDVGVNMGWARSAAKYGAVESYAKQLDGNMLPNYPPLSIFMFGSLGKIYQWTLLPSLNENLPIFRLMIKLPAIAGDLLLALAAWFGFRKLRGEREADIAAAIVVLHPILIHNSAVWGQTDVLYTAAAFVAVLCALWRKWIWVGVLVAAALLLKAQAISLLPALAIAWLFAGKKRWRSIPGALAMTGLVLLPFIVAEKLQTIWNVYTGSVGHYKNISLAAYNFWYALLGSGADGEDTQIVFGIMQYRTAGLILFSVAVATILTLLWPSITLSCRASKETTKAAAKKAEDVRRRAFGPLLLIATGLIASAFFLFNTQMHERYHLSAMVFLLPLAFLSGRGALLYAFTVILYLGNLIHVVQFGWIDKAFVQQFPGLSSSIAAGQVLLFVLNLLEARRIQKQRIALIPKQHPVLAWIWGTRSR